MKKFLALIMCFTMIFVFSACGDSDVRGEVDGKKSDTVTQEEKEYSFGLIQGAKYENEFIGIGCEFDESWTFYTEEQIKQLNNISADLMGEELAESIKNATIIYDMMASNTNGSNVNINLEKVGLIQNAAIDIKTRLENTLPSIKEGLTNMGLTNITSEITTVTFAGKKTDAIKITGDINGVKLYETVMCIKTNQYITSIAVTSVNTDKTGDIISKFYKVG